MTAERDRPTDGRVPARRPTLATVATVAGTSVPTVSKVLRGGTDVSEATRMRVLDAVRAVGYARRGAGGPGGRPSGSAGAPAAAGRDTTPTAPSGLPAMIDLVVNHVEGSWANRVLTGVEQVASAADLDVVITLARDGADWVSRLLRRPSRGAVVVLVDPTSSQFGALAAARIPVVLIDPMTEPEVDVPSVGVANWDGGRIAGEHLAGLGHRHFGVVAGGRTHRYSRARVDGFRSAVDAAVDDPRIRVVHGDWDRDRARRQSHALLTADPDITAVFACSDLMALGVYDTLEDLGLTVPDDISVVGLDDLPEAAWARPALTTIRQPSAEMGATAVTMLLDLIAGRRLPGARQRVEMSTELIIRESTTRPRAR